MKIKKIILHTWKFDERSFPLRFCRWKSFANSIITLSYKQMIYLCIVHIRICVCTILAWTNLIANPSNYLLHIFWENIEHEIALEPICHPTQTSNWLRFWCMRPCKVIIKHILNYISSEFIDLLKSKIILLCWILYAINYVLWYRIVQYESRIACRSIHAWSASYPRLK